MGHFKAVFLRVICLALVLNIPALAQEAAATQKPAASKTSSRYNYGPWKKVAEGIWKANISRFPNASGQPKNPEFAVVRLSSARYDEFQQNRKGFLNDHKIFSKDVNKQDSCSAANPQTQPKGDAYYYILVPHWPGSSAACAAYAEWSEPAS